MGDPGPLIDSAVEAARRALRRLDDDELSPRLERVAASSARRLPPPLRKTLVEELEASDWLRQRALDEWEGPGGDPPSEASELWLRRPEGWEERLAELSEQRESRAMAERAAELDRDNRRLRSRVEELEARVRTAEEDARRAVRATMVESMEEAERLRERVAELHRSLQRLEEERRAERGEAERVAAELAEADTRITELRDALRKARRRVPGEGSGGPSRSFGRGSPLETARALDQLRGSLEAGAETAPAADGPPPLELPDGVRPDRAEAVRWLLGLHRPVTLLVDGYNLAFALDPDPDGVTRERVVTVVARIRRLADAPIRPVVVWDSSTGQASHSEGRVEVRFVPSADEAVVAEAEPDTVVVSSDREVRERSEEKGAVGLWASAISEWVAGR